MGNTKDYWKQIVEPDDIDAHMVEVGQAEVNANLVESMLTQFPLKPGNTLYVPGAGTGQIFDFVPPSRLGESLKLLFSDIKPEFLNKLETRIPKDVQYRAVVDDIEESKIIEKVDAVLIVLVLQHIDWRKGLENILLTRPERIFLIIQEQDQQDTEIRKRRKLRPTMQKFAEIAKTELVPKEELIIFLEKRNYTRRLFTVREVPDSKRMLAMVFEK